jgi:hypothetical protein
VDYPSDLPPKHVFLLKGALFPNILNLVVFSDHGDEESYWALFLKRHLLTSDSELVEMLLQACDVPNKRKSVCNFLSFLLQQQYNCMSFSFNYSVFFFHTHYCKSLHLHSNTSNSIQNPSLFLVQREFPSYLLQSLTHFLHHLTDLLCDSTISQQISNWIDQNHLFDEISNLKPLIDDCVKQKEMVILYLFIMSVEVFYLRFFFFF